MAEHERDRDRDWAASQRDYKEHIEVQRLNVVSVFDRLGYDLTDNDEIARLRDNLRYAETERKRRELMRASKLTWLSNTLVAFMGAGAAGIISYLVQRWGK